jgi:hypothetical protein
MGDYMKEGDYLYSRVYATAHDFRCVEGEPLLFSLVQRDGNYYLKYRLRNEDTSHSLEQIFMKFKFACVGFSIASLGQFWVESQLLNEELQPIWTRIKQIHLVVDKEIESKGKNLITAQNVIVGENLMGWISLSYPRVFLYYLTGLLLLRSDLPTEYLYADILLNYYKIIELITFKRTNRKPNLKTILSECKALYIMSVDEKDIKEFYIVRSQDAAHDYNNANPINRKQAIESKMWADELIIKDFLNRAIKPTNKIVINESPLGINITPMK